MLVVGQRVAGFSLVIRHGRNLKNHQFSPSFLSPSSLIQTRQSQLSGWRKQIFTTLRGHKLQHFLSETSVLPSEFLSSDDETQNHVNPKFQDWEQQDQLIMSWLLASITDALLTRMVNCDTSAQVWKTLELYFATQVRAKVTQFKTQLHNTKKGDLSISDY
ncbi:Retrovirus-related Pol polyprotein from transposon RE1 [Vitis vinifera]|uniref:Retrovirus-related Pol polyprotein from transposon RE1 n=1 Tax=Vitis vinifera TaxID=29760 RepID=A0A438HTA4_VITVI|nr:Retrovirus-related Pol polyprotein from transposon RE1 [Vitis vinifera]